MVPIGNLNHIVFRVWLRAKSTTLCENQCLPPSKCHLPKSGVFSGGLHSCNAEDSGAAGRIGNDASKQKSVVNYERGERAGLNV